MVLAKAKAWLLPGKMSRRLWPMALGGAWVLAIHLLGGLQTRHVAIASLSLLDAYNEKTRSFLKYFFPFMLTGIVYDSMRYYYWWGIDGHVHVAEPYRLEKALFGIRDAAGVVTPNEYFRIHTATILDLFCGFAYLVFVLEYLASAFALFFAGRLALLRTFGRCFFLVNLMGFMTYYIYPAAPPWYVTQYGLGPALRDVHATPAGAARFDAILGTHFFDTMYGQSVDVYGAFPSLHVAYPLLVAWVALVTRRLRAPAIAFYFLMCFSAVYLQHHYILDIILGTGYALTALLVVRWAESRHGSAKERRPLRLRQLLFPEPSLD